MARFVAIIHPKRMVGSLIQTQYPLLVNPRITGGVSLKVALLTSPPRRCNALYTGAIKEVGSKRES